MVPPELNVVTGAFGFTGRYITRQLLAAGKRVKTLTGHPPQQNPFRGLLSVAPLNFDKPEELAESLQGAVTLYNTYWVRFPHGKVTFDRAIENTRTLIKAAEEAGVDRIVHVSITNASEQSPLPYFRGKGVVEETIMRSGLSYAIIRPTVIFGDGDILINNIAWFLRRFPVFVISGSGEYTIQPVFVEDVAEIAVRAGQQDENIVVDAVGPESYTFNEMVRLIAGKVHSKAKIVRLVPELALILSRLVGYVVRDVVITQEELAGLMANLLVSKHPPAGKVRISDWLSNNADGVGTRYASELKRHYR